MDVVMEVEEWSRGQRRKLNVRFYSTVGILVGETQTKAGEWQRAVDG